MKKLFVIIFLGILYSAAAQETGLIHISMPESESSMEFTISEGKLEFELGLSSIAIQQSSIDGVEFCQLLVPEFYNTAIPGEPALPVYSKLFEKIGREEYELIIEAKDSLIVDLDDFMKGVKISPQQASLQKRRDASNKELLIDEVLYSADTLLRRPLLELHTEGKMRSVNIARASFNLFSYNPGQNQLKIYFKLSGKLVPSDDQLRDRQEYTREFNNVLAPVLRERTTSARKKLLKDQPVTMVVLSDSIFCDALKPLLNWKQRKGFRMIEAYTDDPQVGHNRATIKTYLSDLYHNPIPGYSAPSYLLIVGDVEHVPLSQGSGQITDLYYTTYDGVGDYLPDLFQGRIAVKTAEELEVIVNKIIEYEQYKFPDPSFLNKSVLIAGNDGSYASTHGNGQINYAAEYYFNAAHGIDARVFLHPEASSSDAQIRETVSTGAALVNYTGHGEYYGWIDPAFRTSHVSELENAKKYPVLLGNGCSTNVFNRSSGDCFAEAVLKAEDKGAIAYIGCTNDSYWDEDFFWSVGVGPISANPDYDLSGSGFYDKVFHDGSEAVEDWTPSLGEMIFGGNMAVQESSSTLKEYYWEIYQLMGDPSLVPWFVEPANPEVDYPSELAADASWVNLEVEPYDYAAISSNGILLDAMHADAAGLASLFIPEEYRGDTLLLVITGDHRQPFIRQIPDIGNFELHDFRLSSESIETDSILSNGEEITLSLEVINTSQSPSDVRKLVLKPAPNIILIDSTELLPVVPAGDTLELLDAFSVQVSETAKDKSSAVFSFIREADITQNTMDFEMIIQAPELFIRSLYLDDGPYGNGNKIVEEGEEVVLSIEVVNSGSFVSDSIVISFSAGDTLFDEKFILKGKKLEPDSSHMYAANILVPEIDGSSDFHLAPISVSDGSYVLDEVYMVIGKYIEDFSTVTLDLLPWIELNWYRDTSEYLYGPASLRSAEIDHREEASAEIKVHVFEPDSLVFSYMVSSEYDYDFLELHVNGEMVNRWSGNTGWQRYAHMLPVGIHDIRWTYDKDSNTDAGEDAAWIDNVIFPSNAFIPDLYIDSIVVERLGPSLSQESFSIIAHNIGLDSIIGFIVRYRINDGEWSESAFEDTLVSAERNQIFIPGSIDVSEVREHILQVVLRAEEDIWPWNDTMTAQIDHYAYPDLSISYQAFDSSSGSFVNLLAYIENTGNVHIKDAHYQVNIDETYSFTGKSTINLDPGSSTEKSLNLINKYQEWIETGWHDYRVVLAEDSLLSNNELSGTVYWLVSPVEQEERKGIKFYPNPASHILYIELAEEVELPARLLVRDILGRVLYREELTDLRTAIQPGSFLETDGMYEFEIRNTRGEISALGRFLYVGHSR